MLTAIIILSLLLVISLVVLFQVIVNSAEQDEKYNKLERKYNLSQSDIKELRSKLSTFRKENQKLIEQINSHLETPAPQNKENNLRLVEPTIEKKERLSFDEITQLPLLDQLIIYQQDIDSNSDILQRDGASKGLLALQFNDYITYSLRFQLIEKIWGDNHTFALSHACDLIKKQILVLQSEKSI